MLWFRKTKCCFDIHAGYRVAQTSVTRLVECTLDFAVNFFITYRFHKNCLKWEPQCSLHNSERCYAVSDWLLQLYEYSRKYGKMVWVSSLLDRPACYAILGLWEQTFLHPFGPPPPGPNSDFIKTCKVTSTTKHVEGQSPHYVLIYALWRI